MVPYPKLGYFTLKGAEGMRRRTGAGDVRVAQILGELRRRSRRRRQAPTDALDLWDLYETKYTTGSLTQAELAHRLGRPQSYVSKYETGTRSLSIPEVDEIVRELGSNLSAFVRLYKRASPAADT